MARNRMLNPDFWLDEELAALSPHARLLYMGLWGVCDDNHATFPNRPLWVKAQIFPYESVSIRRLLDELSKSGKIVLFQASDEQEYYFIKNFFKFQKIDKPSKPKYPQFEENRRLLDESSDSPRPEDKIKEDKIKEDKRREDKGNSLSLKKYQRLEDITEQDIQEIAQHYQLPAAFVKSKYEDMVLWVGEKEGRGAGRNWRMTLMSWVKKDGLKIIERSKGDPSKRAVDARNL